MSIEPPGVYTVNLTISNIKGSISKLPTILYFSAQLSDDQLTLKEIRITINKSDQAAPVIYEDKIVWVDYRNGNYDIYICTISKR